MFLLNVGENQDIFGPDLLAISENRAGVGVGESFICNVAEDEAFGSDEVEGVCVCDCDSFFVSTS